MFRPLMKFGSKLQMLLTKLLVLTEVHTILSCSWLKYIALHKYHNYLVAINNAELAKVSLANKLALIIHCTHFENDAGKNGLRSSVVQQKKITKNPGFVPQPGQKKILSCFEKLTLEKKVRNIFKNMAKFDNTNL